MTAKERGMMYEEKKGSYAYRQISFVVVEITAQR
jgi:hypothetical protein